MTALSTRPDPTVTYRSVLLLAAVVLLPGLAYGVAVLLPYLMSDLQTLSLAELRAGVQPPTEPEPIAAGWLGLLGLYSLLLAPLGALLALVGCAVQLLAVFPRADGRVSPGVAAGLIGVAATCIVVVAWFLSPLGRALTLWYMD
jgi:hypothetical protein